MNRLFLAIFFIGLLPSNVFSAKKTTSSTPSSTIRSSTRSSTVRSSTIRSPSSTVRSSTISQWSDPYAGGKYGNPGARITLPSKTIDAVHTYANNKISEAIKAVQLAEIRLPIGTGFLVVNPPQVNDIKFAKVEKEFVPSDRIRSRFADGQIKAGGTWSFKPAYNRNYMLNRVSEVARAFSQLNGTYRATITNGELKAISQLARTYDGKPIVNLIDCKANFSNYRIDLEGAGNLTSIENCVDPICNKIRGYFEDASCNIVRDYVKTVINQRLATYQTSIDLQLKELSINYALLNGEPTVTENDIRGGLEGRVNWQGSSFVPFNANALSYVDNRQRDVSLELSDYTFNTLLYQAHSKRYQYSAAQLLSTSSNIQNLLRLNCSNPSQAVRRGGPRRVGSAGRIESEHRCLGAYLDNITSVSNGPYSNNDTGDLVYQSNRKAPSIIIQSNQRAYFDASDAVLELYGPAVNNGNRQLLYRANVRQLSGEFVVKLNAANITGQVKITALELDEYKPTRKTGADDQWFAKFAQFALPIVNDSFNAFFNRFAQFPIPLLQGYNCSAPALTVSPRTIQVDCNVEFSKDG